MVGHAALVCGAAHGGACRAGVWPSSSWGSVALRCVVSCCFATCCVVLCCVVCAGGVWPPSWWGVLRWCVVPLMVERAALECRVLCFVVLRCVVCGGGVWPLSWWGVSRWCVAPLMVGRAALGCGVLCCVAFYGKYSCAYQLKELHQMVQSIVNKSNICGQTKGRKGLQPESNHPAPVPEYPFASVCVDFCDLSRRLCTANGNTYNYVLVVVCLLTGYVVAVPCSKTLTALAVADVYLERLVPVMDMRQEIVSDQDHLVTAEFFSVLCELSGISMKQSTIKRPQSNARAERAVQVVVESLRQWLVKTTQQNWAQLLPLAI